MQLKPGSGAKKTYQFTQSEFDGFARLSGDDNPIHVDPAFAATTSFQKTVAHGMLLYSVIEALLSREVPGRWMIAQELVFPAATFAAQKVDFHIALQSKQADRLIFETQAGHEDGRQGLQGRAEMASLNDQVWPSPTIATIPDRLPSEDATHKGIALGERAELERIFTDADLDEYAALVDSQNPLIRDAAAARSQGFDQRLLPGPLIGGMFSALLGTVLPGRGTNYLKQRMQFLGPVYPGEVLIASVEVIRIRADKDLITLRSFCHCSSGGLICQGESLVYIRDTAG